MRYVFLINTFSLKEKTLNMIKRIDEVCLNKKIDYIIEKNSDTESTEDILKKYKDQECIMMAIGGDGIINRVLNGIVNTKNILGFIPYGTGNDFYRTNKEDLETGINRVDLAKINDKYFINVACFGIDADIANKSDIIHNSKIPSKHRYNAGILYHFFKYKARELEVVCDDKEYKGKYTTVIVCNAKYYGGGYKVGPYSSLNDGLVDVYIAEEMPKLKMAGLILGMKNAKHEKSNKVLKVRTSKLTVRSTKEFSCNIDGEELKDKEFNIEVIPLGMEVYYDQELIDELTK